MNSLYERIETLCKAKNISVTRMCSDIGISRGSLGDLKHNRSQSLSTAALSAISAYFDVSVDYLLGNTPASTSDELLEELRTNTGKRILFDMLDTATEQDIQQVIAIVEALQKAKGNN